MICFPLDNTGYEADALGAWCGTRTRGVFAADGHYSVTANGDMTITVSAGLAWLKAGNYWGVNAYEASPQLLTIATADGALSRIDAVCVRLDKNRNMGEIVVKQGAYNPQPPVIAAPVRNMDYDEIYVATIMVRAGATSILPTDITDQRLNETYCGIMRDGVTSIPTQQLYDAWWAWFNSLQIDAGQKVAVFSAWMSAFKVENEKELAAWLGNFKNTSQADFNGWFENLQNQLDENQAANLLNLIETHTGDNGIHVTPEDKEAWDGKMEPDGDSAENTVTFESGDVADPAVWADMELMQSGEKHGGLFRKMSLAVRNIRWLKKFTEKLNTDLSGKVSKSDVINNLISTDTDKPLSAAQGRALANGNANDSTARLALTKNVALINFSSSTIFTRFGAQYIVKIGKMAFVHLYFSINATLEGNNIFAIIPSGFFPDRGISPIPLVNVLDGSRGTVTFGTDGIIRGDTGFLPGNYCLDFSYPIA